MYLELVCQIICLFVCLGFIFSLENFSLIWIRQWRRRLQILTFTRHSWPLCSEGSLACHTYCNTGHPFIMVNSEVPWHTFCRVFRSGALTTCLYDLGLSRLGFDYSTLRLKDQHSNPLRHRRGSFARYGSYSVSVFNVISFIFIICWIH